MHIWIIAAIALLVSLADASAQAAREGTEQAAETLKAESPGEKPDVSAGPPTQKKAPSDSGKMSDREKAEMYMALAKLAYERFDQLADIAWRLRFAVWTAFGLATWFVLASEKWRLRRMECILASLITSGLIATVVFIWGPSQYERSTRLARVAGYWESAVEHAVGGEKLPAHLRPAPLGIGGHTRYSEGWSVDKPLLPWYQNPVYVSSALVTVLFGLLAIGAIVSKTDWQSGAANKKPSRGPTEL